MLQIAVIGALLALTVFVVLSDTSSSDDVKERGDAPSGHRKAERTRPSPAPAAQPTEGNAGTPEAAFPAPQAPTQQLPASGSIVAGSLQVALRGGRAKAGILQPDPDRLIQTEVVEAAGPAVRAGATIRLVFWILLAGVGVGFLILAVVRGIAVFFENLLGV